MTTNELTHAFRRKNCLITGGAGFIGSNLAIRLAELGARVTIVDAMIPEYGGNLFNLAPVRDQARINFGDIRDRHAMEWLVREQDYVFHLAGQVSHVMSLRDPFPDVEYNIVGTLVVMEAVRRFCPTARVVFTGTRGQYGTAAHLPVGETAPTNPKGIHEISNLTAEKIVQVYNDCHGIHSVMLRLTNTYGPRAQMQSPDYCVANWFVRLAMDNETIPIFGDGRIQRDFLYVDDCVDAILASAASENGRGEVFNVGVDQPTDFLSLVKEILAAAGSGSWDFAPFTPEREAQEPGDFYSDISKIRRATGWRPKTELANGLRETVEYYRAHWRQYWQKESRVRPAA